MTERANRTLRRKYQRYGMAAYYGDCAGELWWDEPIRVRHLYIRMAIRNRSELANESFISMLSYNAQKKINGV